MLFLSSASRNQGSKLLSNIFKWDYIQIISLVFLAGAGLVFIHSIGEQIGTAAAEVFFEKQIQWLCAGSVIWLAASFVKVKSTAFYLFSALFYILSIILLVAVLFWGLRIF